MGQLTELTESFRRCTAQPYFFDRFYARLFELLPSVKPLFDKVEMEHQQAMIRKGITSFLLMAASGNADSEFLHGVRHSHGEEGMKLTGRDYGYWVDAMIDTIQATDPDYTRELGDAWRRVLERGIQELMR
ncbi:MAG: hypothetical protein OEY97_01670 [Nitrospirota bacterium]|nr:hypothetical protein [Nitrospirota bacterium]